MVFSGETLSYLEPCGCTHHQLGGISRKISVVNNKNNKEWFRIDGGDISSERSAQDEIKLGSIMKAFSIMKYDVIGIGEKDLTYPVEFLKNLANSYHLPLVATNLIERNSRKSPFMPSFKIKKGGKIIYVYSIIDKSYEEEIMEYNPKLEIIDPVEALKKYPMKKKNGKEDNWIIIHGSESIAKRIMESYKETPIIFQITHEEEPYPAIKYLEPNSIKVCIGQKGKYVGLLSLPAKKLQIIPLGDDIKQDNAGENIIKEYLNIIRDEDLSKNVPKISYPGNLTYKGSGVCKECHSSEMEIYKKTNHSTAFKTLENAGHDADPECLPCHTIGFYYTSGFISKDETPNFINVGCENCHGPCSDHILNGSLPSVMPNEGTCLQCHNQEHSSTFNFNTYYPKIEHVKSKN